MKQCPDWCSLPGVGQHFPPHPPRLRGSGSGWPHSFSARNPELRFIYFFPGWVNPPFRWSDLCFLTRRCHAVSLEERWCRFRPPHGKQPVCFRTFRSRARCPAVPSELCSIRLSRLLSHFEDSVQEVWYYISSCCDGQVSECEFWIYLAELNRTSFMLLRFVQIIWTNIYFLLHLVPVCL